MIWLVLIAMALLAAAAILIPFIRPETTADPALPAQPALPARPTRHAHHPFIATVPSR